MISFDNDISEIVDMWGYPTIKSIRVDEGVLIIYCSTEQCFICKDDEGQYMFASKIIDFEFKKNIGLKHCHISNSRIF